MTAARAPIARRAGEEPDTWDWKGQHDLCCTTQSAIIDGLEAEVKRLQGLVAEHHNASAMSKARLGDFCPVCTKAGEVQRHIAAALASPR